MPLKCNTLALTTLSMLHLCRKQHVDGVDEAVVVESHAEARQVAGVAQGCKHLCGGVVLPEVRNWARGRQTGVRPEKENTNMGSNRKYFKDFKSYAITPTYTTK